MSSLNLWITSFFPEKYPEGVVPRLIELKFESILKYLRSLCLCLFSNSFMRMLLSIFFFAQYFISSNSAFSMGVADASVSFLQVLLSLSSLVFSLRISSSLSFNCNLRFLIIAVFSLHFSLYSFLLFVI